MPDQWFYRMFGDEFGPVSLDDLREFAINGTLSGNDEVRPEALTMWVPAKAVRELHEFYANDVESAAAVTTTMSTVTSSPIAADEWYYRMTNGDVADGGPLSFRALIELAKSGRLTADDEVRWGVEGNWRRADSLGSLGRLMAEMPYRTSRHDPSPVPTVETPEVMPTRDAVQDLLDSLPEEGVEEPPKEHMTPRPKQRDTGHISSFARSGSTRKPESTDRKTPAPKSKSRQVDPQRANNAAKIELTSAESTVEVFAGSEPEIEDQILDELMAPSRKADVTVATASTGMPSASSVTPPPAQCTPQDSSATASRVALPSSASPNCPRKMPSTLPPTHSLKSARSGPSLAEHLKNPIIWKGLAALVVVGLPICWMNMSRGDPGPECVPVTGIITYKGRPIERLLVTFSTMEASRGSFGETNDKGEFFLSTVRTNDGAYVGENLISLRPMSSKPPPSPAADMAKSYSADMAKSQADAVRRRVEERNKKKSVQNSAQAGELRIPAKYLDPLKSGLQRRVVSGQRNHFEIKLDE